VCVCVCTNTLYAVWGEGREEAEASLHELHTKRKPTWTTKRVPVCIQQISHTNNNGQPTTADNPCDLQ